MYYLAGDIGGTKALLQLIQVNAENNTHITCGQNRFLCNKFDSLESIISSFIQSLDISNLVIESACFGLPGPVNGSKVKLTNLPWIVDAQQIEKPRNGIPAHATSSNGFHAQQQRRYLY